MARGVLWSEASSHKETFFRGKSFRKFNAPETKSRLGRRRSCWWIGVCWFFFQTFEISPARILLKMNKKIPNQIWLSFHHPRRGGFSSLFVWWNREELILEVIRFPWQHLLAVEMGIDHSSCQARGDRCPQSAKSQTQISTSITPRRHWLSNVINGWLPVLLHPVNMLKAFDIGNIDWTFSM